MSTTLPPGPPRPPRVDSPEDLEALIETMVLFSLDFGRTLVDSGGTR